MRVAIWLPEEIVRAARRIIGEAQSDNEAVKLLLLELLTGKIEDREIPSDAWEELTRYAYAELVRLKTKIRSNREG